MPESPATGTEGPLGIDIKFDGAALADDVMVQSAYVTRDLGRVPYARLTILSDANEVEEFGALDDDKYKVGAEISISAYWGSGDAQELFKGVVMAMRLRVNAQKGQMLELTCRDKALTLMELETAGVYAEQKDSDVMTALITDAQLSANVTATTRTWSQVVTGASPWEIVKLMADRNGMVVNVYDGEVTVTEPDPTAAAELEVTVGVDIYDYDVTLDAQRMMKDAAYTSWDSATQSTVEGKEASPPALEPGNVSSTDLAAVLGDRSFTATVGAEMETADLKALAKVRLMRATLAAFSGTCTFIGSGQAQPGSTLKISAAGDRFSGMGYISGVVHDISNGSWTTTTRLGLPLDWVTDDPHTGGPAAAAIATPIPGLQVGTVVQVHDDPDDLQRILVTLPMIRADEQNVWARLGTPYAGVAMGIQFLPEVGDEVIVGFLGDDPNAPIILGSLHNGIATRPEEATEDNFIKKIITREELAITFDDEKKVLTLETPGGHKITMDDEETCITIEDSGGSSIKLDDSGITLDTPGDISLTAAGDITIAATGDATMTGMNVTCEGDTGFTGKGGASAELSAGGQTTVKGAMVMIN